MSVLTSPVGAIGPTEDEKRGIAWWNALPEDSRLAWLCEAERQLKGNLRSPSAADAWATYKNAVAAAAGEPT